MLFAADPRDDIVDDGVYGPAAPAQLLPAAGRGKAVLQELTHVDLEALQFVHPDVGTRALPRHVQDSDQNLQGKGGGRISLLSLTHRKAAALTLPPQPLTHSGWIQLQAAAGKLCVGKYHRK